MTRILAAAAVGALFLGLAVQPAGAQNSWHTEYLTFSAPIAIPGAVLAAGTYTFEVPDAPFSPTLTRVKSRDGKQVYLTQFTRIVDRPREGDVPHVTFGEAAAGEARPINTWFAMGESLGRQFIYAN